jgi:hypothetical protein
MSPGWHDISDIITGQGSPLVLTMEWSDRA